MHKSGGPLRAGGSGATSVKRESASSGTAMLLLLAFCCEIFDDRRFAGPDRLGLSELQMRKGKPTKKKKKEKEQTWADSKHLEHELHVLSVNSEAIIVERLL